MLRRRERDMPYDVQDVAPQESVLVPECREPLPVIFTTGGRRSR